MEFFIHSIEAWIRSQNVNEKFVIIAHSFGGNIATHFSLRYPERVSKLILLSPAGIPVAPHDKTSLEDLVECESTRSAKLSVKIVYKMVQKNMSLLIF